MKRSILGIFSLVFALSALYFFVFNVHAGSFSSAYIRLDRMKASTATTGLVCVTTPGTDNGTEADVQVTFPAGFTVSSAGNWAVATSELPSGATAWPGIGSASSVSGQTVTFPSGDLSAGTLYCFRWTSAGALTTPSSQTSNSGSVVTRTGGAVTIDNKSFALPTITNDQVNVSATVPFEADDFEAAVSTTTTGEPYEQGTEVTIRVDYTSNISYATPLTVEAEWSLGTIAGNGSPTVQVVEYVVGSASNAYGGAAPVIDTVNRTISWDISGFPAGETASVTFKLRTTSNYTGSQQVSWDVDGRVLAQNVQSAEDTLTLTYKYVAVITPTPTPGPTNTPTPGPAPTSSVTSTPAPAPTTVPAVPFAFRTIDVSRITTDLAAFLVSTTQNSTITVRHGLSPKSLTETLRVAAPRTRHGITISPLEADTAYYFRFEAANAAGRVIRSDIYLVTTARSSDLPSIDMRSLVVVSQNVILLQNSSMQKNTVVIPKNMPYSFRFSFSDDVSIEEMRIEVRNSDVLGIFDAFAAPQPNEIGTTVVETSPGLFNALLQTSANPGLYSVNVKTRDENGNLDSQNLFDVKVTEPMKITDKKSGNPVQGAYIELFIFSPTEQDYVPITPEMFPLSDSQFTDQNGEASYVLPNGRYLARISAPGYNKQETEFSVGPEKGSELPHVRLESSGLNIFTFFTYYGAIVWRECQRLVFSLQDYAASHNLFGFAALFTMISFVFLTFYSFRKKLNIPFIHFHKYFHHIVTKSHNSKTPSHPSAVKLAEKEIAIVAFEHLLVSSFILEIFFTAVFGLPKTAPFLILSVLNLVLWILHLVHEDRDCARD